MRSRALGVCCVMLCLWSAAGRAFAQYRAVTTTNGDEDRTEQVELATVDFDEKEAPIIPVPLPPGTVFQRYTVFAPGADVTAGATEQLIFSNTLGKFASELRKDRLVSDDITTTVPNNCNLRRIEFPVIGKVSPSGLGGPYTVEFALYKNCPGAVPTNVSSLIIPGTLTTLNIPDDAPRLISFVTAANMPIPTNFWFGVKFSRDNVGVVVGTPPLSGFSCDQEDYPGFACNAFLGGFPLQPQASFNLEIYADSECASSFTGYKNHRPSGKTYNPGPNVQFADDIRLSSSTCNLVGYDVAVKGLANYEFEIRNNCESGLIAGTQGTFTGSGTDTTIARFTFAQPIPLPQNFWFVAKINNNIGKLIITGQQACIGSTVDRIDISGETGCTSIPSFSPPVHRAFDLAITCAGAAPVGACCDMFVTDENGQAVCREVPKTNCPFPPRFSVLSPDWVQVAPTCNGGLNDGLPCEEDADCEPNGQCTRCEPDPFSPHECGKAACCTPDGGCQNLTQEECYAVPPLDSERQWQIGRYCSFRGQRCPRIACLARTGECTQARCHFENGVCDTTRHCVGGLNAGTVCTTNANCRVCTNKKCSGSPANTVCTGTDQGTCPAGQTCNFITCSADSTCTPTGGTCPAGGVCGAPPNICTAGLIGRACSFNSHCHCPGDEINGALECQVNPSCCDSCPPVGCENALCCTDVCNQDPYCCDVEWDDACASLAREGITSCNIRPANDECAPDGNAEGARLITDVPPSSVESDSGRATVNPSDPGFGCYQDNAGATGLQTVWYKFVATNTSALLQTCSSNSPADDSLLGVYAVGDPTSEGTQCNTLIPNGCSDDFPGCSDTEKNSKVCVKNLIPGDIYYVLVASKVAVEAGKAYRLDISSGCQGGDGAVNNHCPGALPILDGTTPFNLGTAFASMDPPVESCIPSMINDLWYNYAATCTGLLTVDACEANPPDTNLAIYFNEENICPSPVGTPIACNADFGGNCGNGAKLENVDVVEGNIYKIRLADVADNRPSGNLKISCVQADCTAGQFTFTDPPNGVVDAGRPHNPNNAAVLQGIQTLKATGPRDAQASCFTLCETPNGGSSNSIASIVGDPDGNYTITLTRPITGGELTTITYTDIHGVSSTGRFTSHPGNVKADATTSTADVDEILAVLNGTSALIWGNFSGDINRSLRITPADVLEEIDLMTDSGPYDPPAGGWDGSLNQSNNPVCP